MVVRFPPWKFGPAFSSPAFSTPAIWSRVFQSCVFHPRIFHGPAFSSPAFSVPPSHGQVACVATWFVEQIYTGIGRHQRVVQWSNVVHGATDVYFSFINGLLLRVGFLQSLNIIDSRVALGGNAVGLVHECSRSDFYDRPSQCSLGLTFTI